MDNSSTTKSTVLHVSRREILRPLRDQILRISGFYVESTADVTDALTRVSAQPFDLLLIDIEREAAIGEAEFLCSAAKSARQAQRVAFLCNWRIASMTDCPDEIVRTEFDPAAFVDGVRQAVFEA